MSFCHLWKLVLASWFCVWVAEGQRERKPGCEPGCQCTNDFKVNCTGGGFTSIPYSLNVKTTRLILAENAIDSIRSDEIEIYPQLKFLDLSNQAGQLKLKLHSPFSKLKFLETLIFHGCNFLDLQVTHFEGLGALKQLDLSRTNLVNFLPRPFFKDFKSLLSLDLSFNDLQTISRSLLSELKVLEVFTVSHNSLSEVPRLGSRHLLELDLAVNNIKSLTNESFDGLSSLEVLKLNGNPLVSMDHGAFKDLTNLKELHLVDTRLKAVPSQVLSRLPVLGHLDISGTHISTVKSHDFAYLRHLTHIVFKYSPHLTRIEKMAFNNLPRLQHLVLSDNAQLSKVDAQWIEKVPHLRHLIINNNNLDFLPKAGISLLSLLQLNASGNPWHCGDCKLTWLASACQNSQSPCGAECASPAAVSRLPLLKAMHKTCLAPRKDPVNEAPPMQTLYIALLVAVPVIILAILALCCYFLRNRLQGCCGKGRRTCLCKRSSFQSKQPLVGVAKRWRKRDRDGRDSSNVSSNPPESNATGEQPAFKVLAEYPIPITEL